MAKRGDNVEGIRFFFDKRYGECELCRKDEEVEGSAEVGKRSREGRRRTREAEEGVESR